MFGLSIEQLRAGPLCFGASAAASSPNATAAQHLDVVVPGAFALVDPNSTIITTPVSLLPHGRFPLCHEVPPTCTGIIGGTIAQLKGKKIFYYN